MSYTPRKNLGLRAYAAGQDVRWKDVAERLYVSKSTLCDWLNKDLPDDMVNEIKWAIDAIVILREHDERKARQKRAQAETECAD